MKEPETSEINMSIVSEGYGSLRKPSLRSLKRNLSKSVRGEMRSLSIHHLRNVQVEELAADLVHDGDNVDYSDVSAAQQQFKYLESKSEIRCLTRPMNDKRRIKTLLEIYENTLPSLKSTNLSLNSRAKLCRNNQQDFYSSCFDAIEGRLGPGGSLFFHFISSVILLDISMFLINFVFLSFPQITRRRDIQTGGNRTGYRINNSFSGRELLLGDGWLEGTELYYAGYTHPTIDVYSYKYSIRIAYIVVPCVVLFRSLVSLCITFSRAFRHSYYNTKDGTNHVDANLIFSAWDFNIREVKKAVQSSRSIYLDLHILSLELKRKMQMINMKDKIKARMMMIAVEVAIIIMIIASPTAIYYACVNAGKFPKSFSFKLGIPILVTTFNSFIPKIFSELGKAERFRSSRTSSYLVVVRTSFLQVSNLGVLVYYWFSHLACSTGESKCKIIKCWETFFGTQLYTLVVLNLLIFVIITLIQVSKRYLYKVMILKVKSKFMISLVELREFDVGRNSVDVVYMQCLLWLSVYFSPLLSILVVIELLIMLCLKKLLVVIGCYKSVKVWRLGHLETLIKLIHLVAFLLCLSVYLYTIVYVTPSIDCGPFMGYQRSYDIFYSSLPTIDSSVRDSFGIIIRDVFSSVGFRIYIYLIFGIVVFYMRVHAHGRFGMTDRLKRQIELESKDRCYYLETLKLLRNHLRNPGEPMDVRRRRPGIYQLVEVSCEQSKPLKTPPPKPSDPISSLTPCIGPAYLPADKRHMMTSDYYNVMFPNKRASSHAHLDPRVSPQVYKVIEMDQIDINPLSEEVDRLFDFEKVYGEGMSEDGDDNDADDSRAGNYVVYHHNYCS